MPEYVYQPYPACRYHPTQPAIVVQSEAEDLALGPGWVDAPAKLKATPPKKAPAEVSPAAATPPTAEAPPPEVLFGPPDDEEAMKAPRAKRGK